MQQDGLQTSGDRPPSRVAGDFPLSALLFLAPGRAWAGYGGLDLEIFSNKSQDESQLIDRAFWKVARANNAVLAFMKVVGMRRQVGMVGRVVEPEDLTRLPPALPVVGVLAGGA